MDEPLATLAAGVRAGRRPACASATGLPHALLMLALLGACTSPSGPAEPDEWIGSSGAGAEGSWPEPCTLDGLCGVPAICDEVFFEGTECYDRNGLYGEFAAFRCVMDSFATRAAGRVNIDAGLSTMTQICGTYDKIELQGDGTALLERGFYGLQISPPSWRPPVWVRIKPPEFFAPCRAANPTFEQTEACLLEWFEPDECGDPTVLPPPCE